MHYAVSRDGLLKIRPAGLTIIHTYQEHHNWAFLSYSVHVIDIAPDKDDTNFFALGSAFGQKAERR
jgi:hypothetical protein